MIYQKNDVDGKVVTEALKNDPAICKAGLAWGRALCASIIKDSEEISKSLSDGDKAKYNKESEDLEEKGSLFQKEMEQILQKK